MTATGNRGSSALPRRGVALGGFMGTGKTTVGRLLAAELALPFVDLDDAIAHRHGPIAEQFARDGEALFRQRERAMLLELCLVPSQVVATGGGSWVDPRNREALGVFHRVVLTAPIDVLRSRVGRGSGRPLWADNVAQRLADREAAYADADGVFDTAGRSAQDVAQEVLAWLQTKSSS